MILTIKCSTSNSSDKTRLDDHCILLSGIFLLIIYNSLIFKWVEGLQNREVVNKRKKSIKRKRRKRKTGIEKEKKAQGQEAETK